MELNVVTGALSYTGKYVTQRLLALGNTVRTLTGDPDRPNPFGDRVSAAPYNFDNPAELTNNLKGATVLFNTYWVRFPRGDMTHERAVGNSKTLIKAAKDAGVRRIVHVSIANPSEDSPLPYYSGKAAVEKAIIESGLSYAIVRPTVVFGPEDILINNIAWFLRKFPIFAVPGSGAYGIQPIFVEDFADLQVGLAQRQDNVITDTVGPEVFSFNELVELIRERTGARSAVIHVNPTLALAAVNLLGALVHDVVLTGNEIKGLMSNLLVSHEPPKGRTRLSEWLAQHADTVGMEYHSELRKRGQSQYCLLYGLECGILVENPGGHICRAHQPIRLSFLVLRYWRAWDC